MGGARATPPPVPVARAGALPLAALPLAISGGGARAASLYGEAEGERSKQ